MFAHSHVEGTRVTSGHMSGPDAKSPAAPSGIQSSLDLPVEGQSVYDAAISIVGWVLSANSDPASCRVRAYVDGCSVAEAGLLSSRRDVCESLSLSRGVATEFKMLGRIESAGTEPRDAILRITATWDGVREHTLAERSVRLVPALLRDRPYGEVVSPENENLLHRENIYGSGPPLEEPGIEVMNLLRQYLPDSCSVVDVGCGAGAYGPGLMAEGHDWLGLEANAHCCEILERRRLPFRRVDPEIGELPGRDAEWSAAICIEVLEHVKEPAIFLREIARITRVRALFSIPNMEVLPYFHGWGVVPWHLLEGDHRNFFTRASLRNLLARFFRRVEVFSYGEHPLRTREGIPIHVHLFAVADK